MICKKILTTLLIALSLVSSHRMVADQALSPKATKARVTVFIHGSIFTPLSMLNMRRVLSDDLVPTCRYVQFVNEVRRNPVILQDQLMLDLGLHEIGVSILGSVHAGALTEDEKKKAAYGLTAVYDTITAFVPSAPEHRFYYAFGHLGLLSHQYRQEAARELYQELCLVMETLKKRYVTVELHIVAHSHGGNIALNLASCPGDLFVDVLCMLGTPIQHETASYAWHPMFGSVINAFSAGDNLQGRDYFSTAHRKSYQHLYDQNLLIKRPTNRRVFDVALNLNGSTVGIDHANMWLVGRSKPLHPLVYPLPLVAFVPLMLESLEPVSTHQADAYLTIDPAQLTMIVAADYEDGTPPKIIRLETEVIKKLSALMHASWIPADNNRSPVFNGKTARVFLDIAAGVWNLYKPTALFSRTKKGDPVVVEPVVAYP